MTFFGIDNHILSSIYMSLSQKVADTFDKDKFKQREGCVTREKKN